MKPLKHDGKEYHLVNVSDGKKKKLKDNKEMREEWNKILKNK